MSTPIAEPAEQFPRSSGEGQHLQSASQTVTFVPPERWPQALGVYCLAGLLAGVASRAIATAAIANGKAGGIGVALGINILLPASALLIAAWYPRVRTAWLGALLLSTMIVVGSLFWQDWRFWHWQLAEIRTLTNPILVVGCVAYGVIGTVTAFFASAFRRVGLAPDPARCETCGYSRGSLPVCPECGSGLR